MKYKKKHIPRKYESTLKTLEKELTSLTATTADKLDGVTRLVCVNSLPFTLHSQSPDTVTSPL